jgi:prepilin-type N-terminal cleavage/methylation domain-containing protein
MNRAYQPTKANTRGFTIIEVVLVLAIAGLIFLMVFIALPTLQRTQRDTQRKDDLSRIQTQITAYSNNNRGAVPTDLTSGFVKNYLGGNATSTQAGSDYVDPTTGEGYKFLSANAQPTEVGEIGYKKGALCGTDGAFAAGTTRQYAIEVILENQSVPYCVDSR